MPTNKGRVSAFCGLLIILGTTLAACSGGTTTIPGVAPTAAASTLPASAYTTATCSSAGATSASITPGSLVGLGTIATPSIGGCSYSNNFGAVITGATGGTYSGTISLAAPAGLPAIPAANNCSLCTNNGPPAGFSAAAFVPLFYVTIQLNNFTGQVSPDNPNITATVNSITTSTNSANFFIGNYSATAVGATPPAISATSFTGWSNNNSVTAQAAVPLTVTPPNTLTLPLYPCSPANNCAPQAYTSPQSFTLVQVVGYFT